MSAYDRIIIGFPVWASNVTPSIRSFLRDHLSELQGKHIAVFACQSGAGARKAFAKRKSAMGIERFDAEAIFIDPGKKQSEKTDAAICAFCQTLRNF